jgi:hypothetical protein
MEHGEDADEDVGRWAGGLRAVFWLLDAALRSKRQPCEGQTSYYLNLDTMAVLLLRNEASTPEAIPHAKRVRPSRYSTIPAPADATLGSGGELIYSFTLLTGGSSARRLAEWMHVCMCYPSFHAIPKRVILFESWNYRRLLR